MKTHEDFELELYSKRNDLIILGKYSGRKGNILVRCSICGHEWTPNAGNILNNSRCPECSKVKSKLLKRKPTEKFIEELYDISPNIKIISEYINNRTKVECICLIDNHIWGNSPTHLLDGEGCPVCSGRVVKSGVNDLWTTHPEIANNLKNKEQGYSLSHGVDKKVDWVCPTCGEIVCDKRVKDVVNQGLSCRNCYDGISYPNKILYNLLYQLKVDFISEYNPDWIKPKRYDSYFEYNNKKYIVEMDGAIGHGNKVHSKSKITKEESLEVDLYKDKMATEHDIEVIRIDCKDSTIDYIINNILNSKLINIFDLTDIDWQLIDRNAVTSYVFKSADLWNQGYCINQIANILKLHKKTISVYIRKASDLKLCEYIPRKYSGNRLYWNDKNIELMNRMP